MSQELIKDKQEPMDHPIPQTHQCPVVFCVIMLFNYNCAHTQGRPSSFIRVSAMEMYNLPPPIPSSISTGNSAVSLCMPLCSTMNLTCTHLFFSPLHLQYGKR